MALPGRLANCDRGWVVGGRDCRRCGRRRLENALKAVSNLLKRLNRRVLSGSLRAMSAPPMSTPGAAAPLRFGRFELQSDERRLLVDGAPAALGGRAFDLLLALAERPGQLVGKHALMDLVWPGLVVQENNLAAQISALRKVLGDERDRHDPGARLSLRGADRSGRRARSRSASARRRRPRSPRSERLGAAHQPARRVARLARTRPRAGCAGRAGRPPPPGQRRRRRAASASPCWRSTCSLRVARPIRRACAGSSSTQRGRCGRLAGSRRGRARRRRRPWRAAGGADRRGGAVDDAAGAGQRRASARRRRAICARRCTQRLRGCGCWSPARRRCGSPPSGRCGSGRWPCPSDALPAEQALRFGAVALFAERAQAVDHRFAVTEGNAAAVIETCRALDGLPLAIELAASRAPLLGMARLLASMQERLRVLTASRNRAAPSRQQTLRSALEWSHGLLPAREQVVFRRLGVMAGGASLEFIQQVLVDADDDAELDAWAVLDALDTLVDRSLLAVLPSGSLDELRYRLLESPRAYALECLQAAGEQAGAAASPRAGGGGAVRCRLRGILHRSRRRGRVAAPPRARPRPRARRLALGPRRGRRRGGAAHRHDAAARAAAVAAPGAHGAGRCLRGAPPVGPARRPAIAGVDRAELRAGRFAEGARPPRRRGGARLGAAPGSTPGGPLRPLPRRVPRGQRRGPGRRPGGRAGAARRVAGTRRSVMAGAAPAVGRRGRTVGSPAWPATGWTPCTAAAA